MSIIYVGDIHGREKNPFKKASIDFLTWLYENHKEDTIIQGGDLFDASSHHHSFINEIVKVLKKFKDFRVVTGNHDQSRRLGSILKPLQNYNNITIYEEETDVEIEGIHFKILPYITSFKNYGSIETEEDKEIDYSLSHFTPIQEAWGDEGVELKFKVKVAHIFSHIHRHREFKDRFDNQVLISGAAINTRFGEQDWEKNIFKIEKTEYTKIPVPQTFTYETIEFGEEPESKNNILNIKNAPSYKDVYDRYNNYFVRETGVELSKVGVEGLKADMEDRKTIPDKFLKFAELTGINDQEVIDKSLKYLKFI